MQCRLYGMGARNGSSPLRLPRHRAPCTLVPLLELGQERLGSRAMRGPLFYRSGCGWAVLVVGFESRRLSPLSFTPLVVLLIFTPPLSVSRLFRGFGLIVIRFAPIRV
eukprot:3900967-Prymnesium_polylepis.2